MPKLPWMGGEDEDNIIPPPPSIEPSESVQKELNKLIALIQQAQAELSSLITKVTNLPL